MYKKLEQEHESLHAELKNYKLLVEELSTKYQLLEKKMIKVTADADLLTQSLTCSICLESVINNRPVCLPCGHIFCMECTKNLIAARTTKCPQCRQNFAPNTVRELKGLG